MKIPAEFKVKVNQTDHLLFDVLNDPEQLNPLQNPETEEVMIKHLIRLMKENDAPEEQYARLGL